jgi:hypothetical protein
LAAGAVIENDMSEDEVDLFESDLDQAVPISNHRQRVKMGKTTTKKSETSSCEGEHFDLDVSSTEEST